MKKLNILLFVTFIGSFSYAAEKNNGIPTEEEVQKLVAAAWKEPIENIDITYYQDYTGVPIPVEDIRKEVKDEYDRQDEYKNRSKENFQPYEIERRNKNIEANVKIRMEEQNFPRKMKKQVQISNDKQRIDFIKVGPNDSLGPDTPFEDIFVNVKDPNTNEFVSYHYAGDMNTVFVDITKKWTKDGMAQFTNMPFATASALEVYLGIDQGSTLTTLNYIPDPNKMDELSETGFVHFELKYGEKKAKGINKISIVPDPNAPRSRDIIKIGDPNFFPLVIMTCDKNDYSRVYRYEAQIPTKTQIMYVRECDNFDSQGFPHNITEIRYDKDGNFTGKSVYKVVKVKVNPSIPVEVFEFNPPEDYKIVKTDANGVNRTIRESHLERGMRMIKEAKSSKNVLTLKELLSDDSWQVRLLALQELEILLANDKEGLTEAATVLKNDKQPQVRKEAQKVLTRLESESSNKK